MSQQKTVRERRTVLVGVLKDERDLGILLRERWYRIPVLHMPVQRFDFVAFYQPASFRDGKCIRYYASVLGRRIRLRRDLLKGEPAHPRAGDRYVRIRVGTVRKLPRPIRNTTPRRVTFGFTTLRRLLASKNMLQLYGVTPTEQLVGNALRRMKIQAIPELTVSTGGHRYRLDFAVACPRGALAIECDNEKAHSGPRQRRKDNAKDAALKRCGWTVLRLCEREILADIGRSMARVRKTLRRLGGA
jgi:very-short-patch-repair endonuclease